MGLIFFHQFVKLGNLALSLGFSQWFVQILTSNLICEVQDGSSSWSMGVWGQIEISPSGNGLT